MALGRQSYPLKWFFVFPIRQEGVHYTCLTLGVTSLFLLMECSIYSSYNLSVQISHRHEP